MTKIINILAWSILILVSCIDAQPLKKNGAKQIKKIVDSEISDALKDTTIKAISVGLYIHEQDYSFHYGKAPDGRPIDDNSLYKIGSVSKTILGTLVANAVNDQKCKIEDDINQYLDGEYPNLVVGNNFISIKHLLTHTSGLPRNIPTAIDSLFVLMDKTLPIRINEIQARYSKKDFLKDLHFIVLENPPGTHYNYSNAGSELLAHIVENIYEMPYPKLIEQFLIEDFQMNNTKIEYDPSEENFFVQGYGLEHSMAPFSIPFLWDAAGGMRSTLPDLTNYLKFQLDTTQAVISRSHQILHTIIDEDKIGYFWPINSDEIDGRYYGMHGGSFGTQIWLFAIPKHNLGITVVTNQSDMETSGILLGIINRILDQIR